MDDTALSPRPRPALTPIPRSQRASFWGDVRIAWRALIGALQQLPRSRFRKQARR